MIASITTIARTLSHLTLLSAPNYGGESKIKHFNARI